MPIAEAGDRYSRAFGSGGQMGATGIITCRSALASMYLQPAYSVGQSNSIHNCFDRFSQLGVVDGFNLGQRREPDALPVCELLI